MNHVKFIFEVYSPLKHVHVRLKVEHLEKVYEIENIPNREAIFEYPNFTGQTFFFLVLFNLWTLHENIFFFLTEFNANETY